MPLPVRVMAAYHPYVGCFARGKEGIPSVPAAHLQQRLRHSKCGGKTEFAAGLAANSAASSALLSTKHTLHQIGRRPSPPAPPQAASDGHTPLHAGGQVGAQLAMPLIADSALQAQNHITTPWPNRVQNPHLRALVKNVQVGFFDGFPPEYFTILPVC